MARIEQAGFRPFDLLDDSLVLAILRCLPEPESLGCAALVSKRLAGLCKESFAWKPLLDSTLSSSGEGFLALPSEGAGWRERYKQWHTLSSLSWSHCQLTAGSAQPSARSFHQAAALCADRAYVFGGVDEQEEELNDLWMFRCNSAATGIASWELVAPTSEHTPIARMSAALSPVSLSAVHTVGLLLFGGDDGEVDLSDMWLFDTRTAAWTMLLPHNVQQAADASVRPDGRFGYSAITHISSSEVVIFGGVTDEAVDGGFFNDVLSFSVGTRQWTRHKCSGASPSPRYGHAACRVAESMYVLGGIDSNTDSLKDLWEYAFDTRAWTQVVSSGGCLPYQRDGHSLVPLGNRLALFGGCDDVTGSYDPVLRCFDLQQRRWSGLAAAGLAKPAGACLPLPGAGGRAALPSGSESSSLSIGSAAGCWPGPTKGLSELIGGSAWEPASALSAPTPATIPAPASAKKPAGSTAVTASQPPTSLAITITIIITIAAAIATVGTKLAPISAALSTLISAAVA
ncbi:hypothetical protein T492DRAFT_912080 [Pavlovales sp. CCMP2436]|nr:hypothetical protein T492DRAFT_912080 [Pavlovales sp. CCMP2436]